MIFLTEIMRLTGALKKYFVLKSALFQVFVRRVVCCHFVIFSLLANAQENTAELKKVKNDLQIDLSDVLDGHKDLAADLVSAVAINSSIFGIEHVVFKGLSGDFRPRGLNLKSTGLANSKSTPDASEGVLLKFDPESLLIEAKSCQSQEENCKKIGVKMGRGTFTFDLFGHKWRMQVDGGACSAGLKKCSTWIPAWTFAMRLEKTEFKPIPKNLIVFLTKSSQLILLDAAQKSAWLTLNLSAFGKLGALNQVSSIQSSAIRFSFELGELDLDFVSESVLKFTSNEVELFAGSFSEIEKHRSVNKLKVQSADELEPLLSVEGRTLIFSNVNLFLEADVNGFPAKVKLHKLAKILASSIDQQSVREKSTQGFFVRQTPQGTGFFTFEVNSEHLTAKLVAKFPAPIPEKWLEVGPRVFSIAQSSSVDELDAKGWKKTNIDAGVTELRSANSQSLLVKNDDGVVCVWQSFLVPIKTGEVLQGIPGVFPCAKKIWFSRTPSGITGLWIDGKNLTVRTLPLQPKE